MLSPREAVWPQASLDRARPPGEYGEVSAGAAGVHREGPGCRGSGAVGGPAAGAPVAPGPPRTCQCARPAGGRADPRGASAPPTTEDLRMSATKTTGAD